MMTITLPDLQASIQDKTAFKQLGDYAMLCKAFLQFVEETRPTRIISPSHANYVFYQYSQELGYKITRPLNSDLYFETSYRFSTAFDKFLEFLDKLKRFQQAAASRAQIYVETREINKVVYTIQQSIGCIGDSLENPNQSRKRVGQLFETLVKLIIQEVGLECEPRTISLPIPGYPEYEMSYELDLVFSRNKAIVTAETKQIGPAEIIGSVKTTSKDRIDKIFLDKYLLTKLLGRDVPVVAIFLHDVQQARKGQSIFGINPTFKSNHFLGYTVALNQLDGVYYVDPRPEMLASEKLREQISDFQTFLVHDLWELSGE
ncbi:MAG: hypothetical protein AB1894_13410 [Chloroflexota bacterium]